MQRSSEPRLFRMLPSEIKLLLFTSLLGKVQKFYSALGMNWVGGEREIIDESFHPTAATDVMGLPFPIRLLGRREFQFFFSRFNKHARPSPHVNSWCFFKMLHHVLTNQ